MSIKVLYFASLKDHVGRSGDELQVSAPVSLLELWQLANPDLPLPNALLAAVNMNYASLDSLASDGDEVAFFPPVTGG
ncbi:molybdopterin synthase sulfur carrier subunit [Methylomonas koyamae]|uniref:Molybdopterin synthase sulfur carrier subunit n=1 Tax=Methylomonas koyamae TaxID=702114 RepID=A0A177NCP5_9GAMM|nr:MoaD/ThiS family protein [Methylomonas koyamae]OAI15807.1 molybdopterin synthase sulfur carrier subunit [Methylomonas koyamae]